MRKSRLRQPKLERLIAHFVVGAMARTVASLVGVNKSTAAYYFHRLREVIYQVAEDETSFAGEVEVDESDVGGRRKGRRGRGAARTVPVFGLLKRGRKVYAKVIPNAKGRTLKTIMDNTIMPDSFVYSDTFSAYNVLDVSEFKHDRINHSKLFTDKKNHINGIENF